MQIDTQHAIPTLDASSCTTQETSKQGLLFVLSAPSGTGKDTVINALKSQGVDFHVISSVTTAHHARGKRGQSLSFRS